MEISEVMLAIRVWIAPTSRTTSSFRNSNISPVAWRAPSLQTFEYLKGTGNGMCFMWGGKSEDCGFVRLSTKIISCLERALSRVIVFAGSRKIVGIIMESLIFLYYNRFYCMSRVDYAFSIRTVLG